MPDANTVALWSVISSGTVSAASVTAAWLSGSRQRTHDRQLRAEERRQTRREQAYGALIPLVDKRIRQIATIRPVVEPMPPPPEISPEEIDQTYALIKAYASSEVNALLDEFNNKIREFHVNGQVEVPGGGQVEVPTPRG